MSLQVQKLGSHVARHPGWPPFLTVKSMSFFLERMFIYDFKFNKVAANENGHISQEV